MVDFVDMYCGGGLGARGAVMAGCKPVFAFDAWDVAVRTYADNFPRATVRCARAEDLAPTEVPGQPDLLLASPECTGHSIARGNRPIADGSRETALISMQWIDALRPRWIVLENVPRIRGWKRYNEMIDALDAMGYQFRVSVLSANEFGVPQSRQRLFIYGELGHRPAELRPQGYARRIVTDILDPPGTWDMTPLYKPGRAQATIERAERAMAEAGRRASFLVVYYGSDMAGGWQPLDIPLRTVTTLDRFALVEWTPRGHMMRMLQPNELARAMGAPAYHRFNHGSRRDKVRLCGNGICPPVLRRVISHLIPAEYRVAAPAA